MYRLWIWWMRFVTWMQGRADGEAGIPAAQSSDCPQFEIQLKNRFESLASCDARTFAKSEALLSRKQHSLHETQARQEQEAQDIETELLSKFKRCHPIGGFGWGVFLTLVLLVGLEVPINVMVFDLLQENAILTYTLAIGLAGLVTLLGDLVGMAHRRSVLPLGQFLLTLATISVLCGVSYMRTKYFASLETVGDGSNPLNATVVQITFWMLNTLLYLSAAALSYFRHDPDSGFEARYDELTRARRRLAETRAAITSMAASRLQNYYVTLERLRGRDADLKAMTAAYRQANLSNRRSDNFPVLAFEQQPELTVKVRLLEPSPEVAPQPRSRHDCTEAPPEHDRKTLPRIVLLAGEAERAAAGN